MAAWPPNQTAESLQKVIFWANFRDSLVLSPQPSALTSQHYINTLFSSLPTESIPHTSSSSSSSTPKEREKLSRASMEVFPPWMLSISPSTHHPSSHLRVDYKEKGGSLDQIRAKHGSKEFSTFWRGSPLGFSLLSHSLCISCFLRCAIPTWEYL